MKSLLNLHKPEQDKDYLIGIFMTGAYQEALGNDAVKIGLHAGKLINEIARICSGGGGGKPNFAQAGAKDIDKLSDALDYAKNHLQKTLENYSDK